MRLQIRRVLLFLPFNREICRWVQEWEFSSRVVRNQSSLPFPHASAFQSTALQVIRVNDSNSETITKMRTVCVNNKICTLLHDKTELGISTETKTQQLGSL